MKAAVYPGDGRPLALRTLPDPVPGPDDVILKIHRCGICGSDLHMTSGQLFDFPAGSVPGHEFAGEVVEVGSGVTRYRVGDRITAPPAAGCGRSDCEACRRGNPVLCGDATGVMGGFAEFLSVPSRVAVALPETLSMADGALIEPLAVGLYGARMASITPGDRVLVLGAGVVALCTVYWARRMGAGRIVSISRSATRADMALKMGADDFLQYGDSEVDEAADAMGGAPDKVFECVGAGGFIARAIEHCRPFGQVVSMGVYTSPDTLLPAAAGMKGVTLQFPIGYSLEDFHHVAAAMHTGHVDPGILVSSVISLDDLPARFESLRGPNGETKVHVTP